MVTRHRDVVKEDIGMRRTPCRRLVLIQQKLGAEIRATSHNQHGVLSRKIGDVLQDAGWKIHIG
ncbi:hypothetical protein, partial [Escherichia coli]|uniref:hypothetical protein n=1 Tax=Escherichia coli TaxID=562 RepID=UPI003F78FCC1